MAKSRRNRGNAARRDPLTKPVKPPSDPELAALREQKILPVIKDLQSADPKQRSSAASAISNIVQDTKCRKLLLREQIVHTLLTQTLTDSALESRAAGWGILQILAQEEEADFCLHLYRSDILTAIEFASGPVSDKLSNFHSVPKAEKTLLLSIASSIVSLCSALAEAQDDILEAISANAAIMALLFGIITHAADEDVAGLRTDALACLMVLTEDNEKLAEIILAKNHAVYESAQALKRDVSGDGVLACGILHNIFIALQGQTVDIEILDDSAIIPTLSKAVSQIMPTQTVANGGGWSSPLEYQQLALEILASIGTSLNTAGETPFEESALANGDKANGIEEDDDMEDVTADVEDDELEPDNQPEDDNEMDDDEMHADMDMVTGAEDDAPKEGIDDLPVLKTLLHDALPELVRTASFQASSPEIMHLQGLALSALNNIAWSVSIIDFSDEHNAEIRQAWKPTGQAIWEKVIAAILSSDTADVTLATQVTSLAWAVSRSLKADTPLKADEHRKFITLYQATRGSEATQNTEDPFQGLGVKCIGVLGQLALNPAPVALNREIGTFLITVISSLPETAAADAVEALNQIFEIYGEEEYPCDKEVFWKDNFLKHLEEASPKTKAMLKGIDKRTQGELRTRADEAVLNLTRFCAYKRKNKP